MSDRLELSTLIQGLRAELARSWQEGERSAIGFEVGPVDVEVTVQAERSADVRAGIRFWVAEAGAGGSRTSTDTQRILLTLTPRDKRDPSQPLRIAGTEVTDEE